MEVTWKNWENFIRYCLCVMMGIDWNVICVNINGERLVSVSVAINFEWKKERKSIGCEKFEKN